MHVTFDLPHALDLAAELRKPWHRLATRSLPHGEIVSIDLVGARDIALSIVNVMADLAPRSEIGRLRFAIGPFDDRGRTVHDAVFLSGSERALFKLVLADADRDVTADSGVLIRDGAGGQVLIAAAAFPHTLMLSMTGIEESGQLEYGRETYRLVPF